MQCFEVYSIVCCETVDELFRLLVHEDQPAELTDGAAWLSSAH